MVHRKTVQPIEIDPKEIPFLKRKKTSKKEKLESKTSAFKQKVLTSSTSAVSKSARKRQNRKARSNLHGGELGDLLSTLPEVQEITKNKDPFVSVKKAPLNPAKSAKSNSKVVNHEIDRFDKLVSSKTYKQNPFATLKQHIQSTMTRRPEFEKRAQQSSSKMAVDK